MNYGLNAEYYTSPSIYSRETERIFNRSWLCLDRCESIADGCFKTYSQGAVKLVAVRSAGTLRVFHNVCRHRGALLCSAATGPLENDTLTCPYHAWTYNSQGALIHAPNMQDAAGWEPSAFGLSEVACAEWNGYVLVNLLTDAQPFAEAYQAVLHKFDPWQLSELRLAQQLRYDVRANWKLLFQNYSECYHCPTVHPSLSRLTPYKSASNDLTTGGFHGGPMQLADGIETLSTDGQATAPVLPKLDQRQRRLVAFYTLFPTMFISPHPDYVIVHRIGRLEVDRTEVLCDFLFHPDCHPDPQRAVDFWDTVNRQDWHVCELVQEGAQSSGYRPGPYSPLETVLPMFDQHYLATMQITFSV
jgi:Rieske 2Fe-2S family protein